MAGDKQPNILVLWGDDIGITNLSCYGDGIMGYRTPNIDRVPARALAAEQLQTFIDFPPRQKPAAFNLDTVLEKMQEASGGGMH